MTDTDSGIVFFATQRHDEVVDFYREVVGAETWLEQTGCTILNYGDFKFGFCDRDRTDDAGILTFLFDDRAGVDAMHERLGDAARGPPEDNEQYRVYQFFADDPDGRTAEFQTFLHEIPE